MLNSAQDDNFGSPSKSRSLYAGSAPSILRNLALARAATLARLGYLTKAESILIPFASSQWCNEDILVLLAKIYAQQDRFDQSSQMWQRVLDINPFHNEAQHALKRFLSRPTSRIARKYPFSKRTTLFFLLYFVSLAVVYTYSSNIMNCQTYLSNLILSYYTPHSQQEVVNGQTKVLPPNSTEKQDPQNPALSSLPASTIPAVTAAEPTQKPTEIPTPQPEQPAPKPQKAIIQPVTNEAQPTSIAANSVESTTETTLEEKTADPITSNLNIESASNTEDQLIQSATQTVSPTIKPATATLNSPVKSATAPIKPVIESATTVNETNMVSVEEPKPATVEPAASSLSLKDRVIQSLQSNDLCSKYSLSVSQKGEIIQISGLVPTIKVRYEIENCARKVEGVQFVDIGKVELNKTYIVQPGDTLSKIAEKIYGDQVYLKDIARLNNIETADQIRVGQTLALPVVSG